MISRKAVVLDSPVRLAARRRGPRSAWELGLRYAAAYACTLIAVGAAELVLPDSIVLLLGAVTVAGLPLSLLLRRAIERGRLRLGGRPVPRFLINVGVVSITVAMCALLLGPSIAREAGRLFDLSFATQTVKLLMQAFLIFGVCRCLAILNDKDAVLCTVPSFSVLLLLIVVHRGPEVVAFFALWAIASAVLLSLDFRSDIRAASSASVPGLAPNQDLKLSGRALATVLGFSLSASGFLAYSLAGDDASGPDESWISNLTSRLNGLSLDLPDTAGNGGPERQIDFASLPSTPLRTPLWSIKTQRTDNWQVVKPQYWRLFTLALYDGHTWSQAGGPGTQIPTARLGPERWVPDPSLFLQRRRWRGEWLRDSDNRREIPGLTLVGPAAPAMRQVAPAQPGLERGFELGLGRNLDREPDRNRDGAGSPRGARTISIFDIEATGPREARPRFFGALTDDSSSGSSGPSSTWGAQGAKPGQAHGAVRVQQRVRALTSNTGFVPILPGARGIRFDLSNGNTQLPTVRQRTDGSLDVGVMVHDSVAWVQSEVAPLEVYGLPQAQPPTAKIARPLLSLSPEDSRLYLQLPPALPKRVRDWARQRLRLASASESNYKRALRLSAALREGAFYTLRPPLVPADRDATDFFLFDSRRGYCTHFAGSLAATCRVAGIPSRIVSGFTNAEWPPGFPGVAELRESGSHAWVEIWEPGWGWVLVDPTPPDSRGNNAPSLLQSWEDLRGIIGEFLVKRFAALSLALIALAASVPLLALLALRHRRHASRLGGAGAPAQEDRLARAEIAALFERASRKVSRRFRPRAPWETPGEWLGAAREPLALRDDAPLFELLALFEAARFSPRPLGAPQAAEARQAHERLSWARKPAPKPQAPQPKLTGAA